MPNEPIPIDAAIDHVFGWINDFCGRVKAAAAAAKSAAGTASQAEETGEANQ